MKLKKEDEISFNEIEMGGVLLRDADLVYSCPSSQYRLYAKIEKSEDFRAVALYNSCSDNTSKSWGDDSLKPVKVNILFDVWTPLDGVRHMKFNDCTYDSCMGKIIEMLKIAREVELGNYHNADILTPKL